MDFLVFSLEFDCLVRFVDHIIVACRSFAGLSQPWLLASLSGFSSSCRTLSLVALLESHPPSLAKYLTVPEKLFLPTEIQPSPYGWYGSDGGDEAKRGGQSPLSRKTRLEDAAKE